MRTFILAYLIAFLGLIMIAGGTWLLIDLFRQTVRAPPEILLGGCWHDMRRRCHAWRSAGAAFIAFYYCSAACPLIAVQVLPRNSFCPAVCSTVQSGGKRRLVGIASQPPRNDRWQVEMLWYGLRVVHVSDDAPSVARPSYLAPAIGT